MLLREEIEKSFGTGPEHRPVEQRIAAGRRALWRRRVGAGLAAVGVVAVLGTTYAVVSPDSHGNGAGQVAVDPTPTPSQTSAAAPWEDDTPLRYADGELQIHPGVIVHEHLENPYGLEPPNRSDALDLTYEGSRSWTIIELRNGETSYSESEPSNGWASFADWVADQVGAAASGWPRTLRLADDGRVVASRGSEILQRTDDPRLGPSFAPPGTPTGAALVRAAEDGVGYFVVWRVLDGELDVITTPPRDVVGASWPELLAYARSQYASGEGLR
jgi:hypothetical protein